MSFTNNCPFKRVENSKELLSDERVPEDLIHDFNVEFYLQLLIQESNKNSYELLLSKERIPEEL